jgi:acetyl-CoA acetyltransferase
VTWTAIGALFQCSSVYTGYRYGNGEIVDGMVKDGLWDVYNDFAMGVAADQTAEEHGISREASVGTVFSFFVQFVSR